MLAVTRCQVGDVIESLVSSDSPLLRLYFLPCPIPEVSTLNIERLQLYRLNASHFSNMFSYYFEFIEIVLK